MQVYDLGVHQGELALAMEWVRGGSLQQQLTERRLAPREAAILLESVATAVAAAHEARVVHLDIKPANVLLTEKGYPKISDFGIAHRLDVRGSKMPGQILGTPGYMAPEQAQRQTPLTPAADVHALGAVLYEMLTGQPPFVGNTDEILDQTCTMSVEIARQLRRTIDPDLCAICLRCLEKDPAQRFATAKELAESLAHFIALRPLNWRHSSATRRLYLWGRRRPWFATASVLGAIAAVSLAVVASLFFVNRTLSDLNQQITEAKDDAETQRDAAKSQKKEADRQRDIAQGAKREAEYRREEADRLRALANRYRYVSQINLANRALQEGNIRLVTQLLLQQQPEKGEDLRSFEWHHLGRQANGDAQVIFRGETGVICVQFTPDGKHVLAGSADGVGRLFKLAPNGGKEFTVLEPKAGPISSVAASPDGRLLATGHVPGAIRVWKASTGELVHEFEPGPSRTWRIAFSVDSQFLASGGWGNDIRLWDLTTKKSRVLVSTTANVGGLCFSPDGKRVAAVQNGDLWVIGVDRNPQPLTHHHNQWLRNVNHLAFAPDGQRLALVQTNGVEFCDPQTGKTVESLPTEQEHQYLCAAFSPDGRFLAVGGSTHGDQGSLTIWDLLDYSTGPREPTWFPRVPAKLWQTLQGHTGAVQSVGFSPDGKRLVSGSADGTVRLWDLQAQPYPQRFEAERLTCATRAEVLLLLNRAENRVAVIDVAQGTTKSYPTGQDGPVQGLALSPDGKLFATATDDHVVLAKAADGTVQHRLEAAEEVLFTPDGRHLAAFSKADASILLFDVMTGRKVQTFSDARPQPGDSGAQPMAFNPAGTELAVAGRVHHVAGNVITIRGSAVTVWDVKSGRLIRTLQGHGLLVRSVAYSPDGRWLASAGRERRDHAFAGRPGELFLWNAATGAMVRQLRGHLTGVNTVAFTTDGHRLASGSGDDLLGASAISGRNYEVRVWDVPTGEEVLSIPSGSGVVHEVGFGPGSSLWVRTGSGTQLWPTSPALERTLVIADPRPKELGEATDRARQWHLQEAIHCGNMGNAAGLEFRLQQVASLKKAEEYSVRGTVAANRQQWVAADKYLTLAAAADPENPTLRYQEVMAALARGDSDEFVRRRRKLIRDFARATDSQIAALVILLAVLTDGPWEPGETAIIQRFVRACQERSPRAEAQALAGAVHFRRKAYGAASQSFDVAFREHIILAETTNWGDGRPPMYALLFSAMTDQAQGRPEQARRLVAEVRLRLDLALSKTPQPLSWEQRVYRETLLAEAQKILGK
ncbi:MAG: serine/threonine protein kinase [Planctomycetia bacterium]|nr:serine/threonine protein kinase [Planctomycetia bacterium]